MTNSSTPSVLFVCVKNAGKSQMAAALIRKTVGDTATVDSAGTQPGNTINALSAQTLHEVGVDISDQTPKQLTQDLIAKTDLPRRARRLGGQREVVEDGTATPASRSLE